MAAKKKAKKVAKKGKKVAKKAKKGKKRQFILYLVHQSKMYKQKTTNLLDGFLFFDYFI